MLWRRQRQRRKRKRWGSGGDGGDNSGGGDKSRDLSINENFLEQGDAMTIDSTT